MRKFNTTILKIGRIEFTTQHLLVITILSIAFVSAFTVRLYPIKYGYYLNEYDPYYNYRATEFIIDHGFGSYLNWHDTMSWYPEGRDIAKTSQSGLHIITAFIYKIFSWQFTLWEFTIILPVIIGSLTTIVIFMLVRILFSNTTAGMIAALIFVFSPPLIMRGNLGWFKSEPMGLFFGLLSLYLIVSAIKHIHYNTKNIKQYVTILILKASLGGILLGFANASWAGTQYFVIPITLIFIALPFFRTKNTIKISFYVAILFTIFAILTTSAFSRPSTPFLFGISTTNNPLVGPGIALVFGTLFIGGSFLIKKIENIKILRNVKPRLLLLLFLTVCIILIFIFVGAGILKHINDTRYSKIINPFTLPSSPLFESVAEHARPTFMDYVILFSTLLFFAAVGLVIILRRRNELSIFALIIGTTAIYVSTALNRMLVYASIGIVIFAAIGISGIVEILFKKSITSNKAFKMLKLTKKISPQFGAQNNQTKPVKFKVIMPLMIYTVIILSLVIPLIYPPEWSWLNMIDIPPTILNGGTGYTLSMNDWIDSLNWISLNVPKDSKIGSWWDYGYWITTVGNRTTLADNATINSTRIQEIAKMFMNTPEEGIEKASRLKVNYILTFVVAFPISINNSTYYVLGYGGDESKISNFISVGKLNETQYIYQNRYTQFFWNSTLIGKLIPFTPIGYTLFENGQATKLYSKPPSSEFFTVYSKGIKSLDIDRNSFYSSNGQKYSKQDLDLVYASPSFTDDSKKVIFAILIYKFKTPSL